MEKRKKKEKKGGHNEKSRRKEKQDCVFLAKEYNDVRKKAFSTGKE